MMFLVACVCVVDDGIRNKQLNFGVIRVSVQFQEFLKSF